MDNSHLIPELSGTSLEGIDSKAASLRLNNAGLMRIFREIRKLNKYFNVADGFIIRIICQALILMEMPASQYEIKGVRPFVSEPCGKYKNEMFRILMDEAPINRK